MMSAARNPCFLIHTLNDDAYTDAMELNDDNECMPAFLEIHVLRDHPFRISEFSIENINIYKKSHRFSIEDKQPKKYHIYFSICQSVYTLVNNIYILDL